MADSEPVFQPAGREDRTRSSVPGGGTHTV